MEDARKQLEMLQVLKDHPKIVEERDECRKRVAELEHDIENKVAEILSLREVKMIVGEEPVALPQVRERINEIKAQEIKVEAQRLFSEYKTQWEKSEKPKQVYSEACRVLSMIIGKPTEPHARAFPAELFELGLPSKVIEILNAGIDSKTDAEFKKRVEKESDRKAVIKVKQTLGVEWPNWLNPRVKQLEDKIISGALAELQGPWVLGCGRCGASMTRNLTPREMEDLIRDRAVDVDCPNPQCGFILHTKIPLVIRDLIQKKLGI